MPTALRIAEPVTIEAFDTFFEAQADTAQFEFVEGIIVMMANPKATHAQITANIGAPLKLAMDPRGGRTYQGGIRVQCSANPRDADKARPDVVVRCGPNSGRTLVTDPVVNFAVLSPSPTDVDRGPKLDFDKSRQTVRHIALVYQDQMRVEHCRRTDQGFEFEVLTKAAYSLHFEAVAFELPLVQAYFGVEL